MQKAAGLFLYAASKKDKIDANAGRDIQGHFEEAATKIAKGIKMILDAEQAMERVNELNIEYAKKHNDHSYTLIEFETSSKGLFWVSG